ncbi:MAG: Crp/Fnr family transcriptional regulator [Thermodesulfobacteriota bacterium]|nr:Crp/Fnr family transcriptional regulator [Thermodesulfobacteriota bacterium]
MDIASIIADTQLFKGLPNDQIREIAGIAQKETVGRGGLIFADGESGNGFYIVAEGKIKIFKVSLEGKEQILHIFGPGEPFGEVPVFTGAMFPANAEALTKSTILFFPKSAFIRLIEQNTPLVLNMLGVLSKRLRQFTIQVEHLSLKEVPGRLAAYLLLLSEEQNGALALFLPISKGQLASLLGTIPETLSRIFAKMGEKGYISVDGREITILDFQGLEMLAEDGRL